MYYPRIVHEKSAIELAARLATQHSRSMVTELTTVTKIARHYVVRDKSRAFDIRDESPTLKIGIASAVGGAIRHGTWNKQCVGMFYRDLCVPGESPSLAVLSSTPLERSEAR